VDAEEMQSGGPWSIYWYNGVMVSSEIARGLDILELTPSEHVSANEIEAAKTARFEYFNVQGQQKFVWPPSFALARAYLDQLERSDGMDAEGIQATRQALASAEEASGTPRRVALTVLASQLVDSVSGAEDREKVRKLATAVRELAEAQG
jgi:hypothetical protein